MRDLHQVRTLHNWTSSTAAALRDALAAFGTAVRQCGSADTVLMAGSYPYALVVADERRRASDRPRG
jgi:hypothetical protein